MMSNQLSNVMNKMSKQAIALAVVTFLVVSFVTNYFLKKDDEDNTKRSAYTVMAITFVVGLFAAVLSVGIYIKVSNPSYGELLTGPFPK